MTQTQTPAGQEVVANAANKTVAENPEIRKFIASIKGNRSKVLDVPIEAVSESVERNIRDPRDYENLLSLIADLRMFGQQKEVILLKQGNEIFPLVGNLRRRALGILQKEGAIDPLTVKRDDKGEVIPGTGKPFSTIRGVVLENLSERERYDIMADHSQTKSLNKVGVYLSCRRGMEVGYNLQQIVVKNFEALNLFSGRDRKKVEAIRKELEEATKANKPKVEIDALQKAYDAACFYHHKGTVENWYRVFQCPDMVHQQYMRKLHGETNWPSNRTIMELLDAHKQDVDDPALLGKINKQNPGPRFLARWKKEEEAQQQADETGKPAKATNMANREQVEGMILQCSDRFAKAIMLIVLRRIPSDQLPLLDQAHSKLLKGEIQSDAYEAALDAAFQQVTD